MQPSLILPIILKDLRANRWLFAAFFAVSILSTVTSFVSPQDPGPLARSGMFLVYCLYILLALLAMARVVHADPPASDTAFLATRPISGTTLFFAKLLLVMVALSFIPSAIDAVAMLLLGFETSVVLERSFGIINWMTIMASFAICTMTKKLRWFLLWCVIVVFGIGVFLSIGIVVFFSVFVVFPLLMNPNWAELAGMHSFLVDRPSFENTTMLAIVVGPIALFGITWQHYVRPNTPRSACLFVGAILITCLLGFIGYRQALHLHPEAKASTISMTTGALASKPTDLYPSENKITSSVWGYFSFWIWPEDIENNKQPKITGEARMRFLNGARPMAYRAGYARLVFEDLANIPDDNLEKVQVLGFDGSWEQLKIHVPAARRGEFDALADNTTRFAWLAKEVQAQVEAGDKPAADSYATLLLQGWGVERNLPQAKILLQDAIKRRNFDGAQLYVQLHVDDPDQPEGVRDVMDLMISLLEAGHTPILWSTELAMPILAKSQEESDRALGLQLTRSVAQNVKQVYSNQNDESWTKNPNVKDNAKMALDSLIDSSSPQDLALAEQLVKAWLARDPQSKEAKGYQTKLKSL